LRHFERLQFAVADNNVGTGAAFFDQSNMIADDVAHDAVVRHSVVDAGRHVGSVLVAAGQFLFLCGIDGVDCHLRPHVKLGL
jgi:hypothetical protein